MARAVNKQKIASIVQQSAVKSTASGNDTIKLWESYRDQALLWRSLALLQIPATLMLTLFSMILWYSSDITLNVPRKPLPGIYRAQEIPDTEFLDTATNFINLIATYTPPVALRQFTEASKMLHEPALEKFRVEMIEGELKAIEHTQRTQIFFFDPTASNLERISSTEVQATLVGDRQKMIAGRMLPMNKTLFEITMTTVPRNTLNPYGIVVTNVKSKNIGGELG